MAEFGVSEWLVALAIFLFGAAAMWHADRFLVGAATMWHADRGHCQTTIPRIRKSA